MSAHNDDLLARACRAWAREKASIGAVRQQPGSDSYVTYYDGVCYVVLTNVTGPLAVYQVNAQCTLRRLKSWPDAVVVEVAA
jgi:hypothetical protein